MKKKLILVFLSICSSSFGQNSYRISDCIWNYTKPENYIVRVDNFEKTIKTGEKYLKKDGNVTLANDDVILLSIAKTDSSEVNMVLASYKSNINIQNFTLKGYAEKFAEYFRQNPDESKYKKEVNVVVRELFIDKIKFYAIEKKTNYPEQNYSFTYVYFVAEIKDKEFSIATMYDNEIDKSIIEKSIINSTFE